MVLLCNLDVIQLNDISGINLTRVIDLFEYHGFLSHMRSNKSYLSKSDFLYICSILIGASGDLESKNYTQRFRLWKVRHLTMRQEDGGFIIVWIFCRRIVHKL